MLLETEFGLKISGVQSSTFLLVFQVFLRQIIVDREIKTLKAASATSFADPSGASMCTLLPPAVLCTTGLRTPCNYTNCQHCAKHDLA